MQNKTVGIDRAQILSDISKKKKRNLSIFKSRASLTFCPVNKLSIGVKDKRKRCKTKVKQENERDKG